MTNSEPSSSVSVSGRTPSSMRTSLELYRKALLLEVVGLVAAGTTPESTWDAIVRKLRWTMDFDHAALALVPNSTDGSGEMEIISSHPKQFTSQALYAKILLELNASGDGFRLFRNPAEFSSAHADQQALIAVPYESGLLFVSRTSEKVYGAMIFASRLSNAFGHPEIELAALLAGQLALSLERRDHVEQLQVAASELERQRALEVLTRSERLASMGRLAATIAHEINNPLEAVTNLLYLIRTSEGLSRTVEEYVKRAEEELLRASEIANQTLRFHKQLPRPTALRVDEMLNTVLAMHHARVRQSHIDVQIKIEPTPEVRCYEGEIRQVINNLVGNAIDAMPENGGRLILKGRLAIDWRTGRSGVCVTVADTGTGMSSETVSKIFDPFFTTKGLEGTGLGLWVSQGIIDRHEGRIQLRSSTGFEQHGTVFRVFLPVKSVQRAEA